MKQISCKAGYKTIQADSGMTFISKDDTLAGEVVHLGKHSKKGDYREITLSEAVEIAAEQEILAKQEIQEE
jgi:hypothetical protein